LFGRPTQKADGNASNDAWLALGLRVADDAARGCQGGKNECWNFQTLKLVSSSPAHSVAMLLTIFRRVWNVLLGSEFWLLSSSLMLGPLEGPVCQQMTNKVGELGELGERPIGASAFAQHRTCPRSFSLLSRVKHIVLFKPVVSLL